LEEENEGWSVWNRATPLCVAFEIVEVVLKLGMWRTTIHPIAITGAKNLIRRKRFVAPRISWYHKIITSIGYWKAIAVFYQDVAIAFSLIPSAFLTWLGTGLGCISPY
jgi:hypothetical protein